LQKGYCNFDKASRRALIKSRLRSINLHYEETAGCSKPQHMEIHQRIGLLIMLRVFFA